MLSLAHLGVHVLHIMLTTYQVFGAVVGESFSVDIDKSAIRYYSRIFPFYFILLIQVLVICFFFFLFCVWLQLRLP